MQYKLEEIGVGTRTIEGSVVMITSPLYPFGKNLMIDMYKLRYSKYTMSNMAIIRLDEPAIPFTKEEFAVANPWYNKLGVEKFYKQDVKISDFEDIPVDCLSVTMAVKNKFCVGQEISDGIIVGVVLSSHYEKIVKTSNWDAWDKFGDWRAKPVYSIQLREPQYRSSIEEFYNVYKTDLQYFTDEYKEELYYKQEKDLYLSLPEDAISE